MSKFVIALNENDEKVVIITHSNQDFGSEDFKHKLNLKNVISCGNLDVNEDGNVVINIHSRIYKKEDAIFIEDKFHNGEMKMFNLIRRYGTLDIVITNIKSHRYLKYIKDCNDVTMVNEESQNKTFGYINGHTGI